MTKLIAFNKPFQVHSQFRAEYGQFTLKHFIQDQTLRIAGRLDCDSEGLMLLTDHGGLNQQITHPKFKQFKTYIVQVEGNIDPIAIKTLQQGVMLKDGMTLPAKVRQISEPDWLWQRTPPIRHRANIPTSWLEICICEGKNRQVRRMTAAVGFPTLRLIRTQIGSISLLTLALKSGETTALNLDDYLEFKPFQQHFSSKTTQPTIQNKARHYQPKKFTTTSHKKRRKNTSK